MIIATHSGKEMKSFQILGSYVKTTSQDFTEKHFTFGEKKIVHPYKSTMYGKINQSFAEHAYARPKLN